MKTFPATPLLLIILTMLSLLLQFCQQPRSNDMVIDLSGKWRFQKDSLDQGITQKWFNRNLPEPVNLPGSMNENGKGNPVNLQTQWTGAIIDSSFFKDDKYKSFREPDNFKVPFWLQPQLHYVGPAWYQKNITIPEAWKNRNIRLVLERVHWECTVWIDSQKVGTSRNLGMPQTFNLPQDLQTGNHTLTFRIDNRLDDINVGPNAHSVTDHTQTNWNGVVGKMELRALPQLSIEDIQLYPDLQQLQVKTRVTVSNQLESEQSVTLTLNAESTGNSPEKNTKLAPFKKQIQVKPGQKTFTLEYPMGDEPDLWSAFHPHLYEMQVRLTSETAPISHEQKATFGMREVQTRDEKILLNGRRLYLRGTLECAIFPKTGYPPTSKKPWIRRLQKLKDYGLNHVRFHSWCPPEAAFEVADSLGIYFQVEASAWPNTPTSLGDGKPVDRFIRKESLRMIEEYGNHPSFIMMASGNEPGGSNQVTYLNNYLQTMKAKDERHLYTGSAGWPVIRENQYHDIPAPRIQQWGAELTSIINKKPPQTAYDFQEKIDTLNKPVISHENGQWCVYPDFKEISQYDGVLRARNFEIFQHTLHENGMAHLADSFLLASGKLQRLCYKADIEAALRTKSQSGFQLLQLHDFPGQGTALVGLLNAFWEEKGYITAREFSRFCNQVVPLVRLDQRIFYGEDTLQGTIEVANYSEKSIDQPSIQWTIQRGSKDLNQGQGPVLKEGEIPKNKIARGHPLKLGKLKVPLNTLETPQKYTLTVSVNEFSNAWDFWVYPRNHPSQGIEDDIYITRKWDTKTKNILQNGGKVLLTPSKGAVNPEMGGDIGIGFSSIFWNTAWTRGQAPHTLGVLCDPKHPVFKAFPTSYHSNWQWWDAMSHSNAIRIRKVDRELKPLIRVIDDWFTNRPLALLFEAKIGKGKLMVSGIDFNQDLSSRKAGRQMLYSIKRYMASEDFAPEVALNPGQIDAIYH